MQKSLNLPSMLAAVGLAATVLLASLTTSCRHLTPTPVAPEQCQIVVPADAIPSENHAAKELQDGLRQIFGVEIPIVHEKTAAHAFYIGQSHLTAALLGVDWQEMKRDEMIVAKYKDNYILAGARPRGALYAVYELLEHGYGVRYWTHAVTDWPKASQFYLPSYTKRFAPPFFSRHAYYDLINKHQEFAVKMRTNCTASKPELGGREVLIGFVHTFDRWLPAAKYFDKHPEWYSLRDGVRVGGQREGQLCLTNQEMRKEFIKVVLEKLAPYGDGAMIDVSQNDNISYCQCEKCQAFVDQNGNQTDLLLDFVNEVAAAVERHNPTMYVETLAYQYTRQVPGTVQPRKNVIIRLCTIECMFGHPLNSDYNASFRTDIANWKKVAPQLFIWNYVTDFAKFYQPMPNWRHLGKDLQMFVDHGAIAIFEQGCHGPGSTGDLTDMRVWVTSKLLWNPKEDVNRLIREFANGYYGAAGPEFIRYIDIICDAIRRNPDFKTGCFAKECLWLDDDAFIKAWQCMERAKKLVANDPTLLKRVEVAAVSINLAMFDRPDLLIKSGAYASISDAFADLDRLFALAKEGGGWRYTESDDGGSFKAVRRNFGLGLAKKHVLDGEDIDKVMAKMEKDFGLTGEELRSVRWSFEYFKDRDNFPFKIDVKRPEGTPIQTIDLPTEGWRFTTDPERTGHQRKYFDNAFDDAKWALQKAAAWEGQGFKDYDGVGWYRIRFKMPAKTACKAVELQVGAADEQAWVWLNGKYVGQNLGVPEEIWDKPFALDVTNAVQWGAENILTVRVSDIGYAGGLWKPLKIVLLK